MDIKILELATWSRAIRSYPDRAADIAQTFSYNQLISKQEVAKLITKPGKVLVLGGWYCNVFATFLNGSYITSVDIDETCAKIGKFINPHVDFVTEDALTYKPHQSFDWIINTSTEHMDHDKLLLSFQNIKPFTKCVFQNNNMSNVEEHVNCFDSVDAFKEYLSEDFDVKQITETELDTGKKRWTAYVIKRET